MVVHHSVLQSIAVFPQHRRLCQHLCIARRPLFCHLYIFQILLWAKCRPLFYNLHIFLQFDNAQHVSPLFFNCHIISKSDNGYGQHHLRLVGPRHHLAGPNGFQVVVLLLQEVVLNLVNLVGEQSITFRLAFSASSSRIMCSNSFLCSPSISEATWVTASVVRMRRIMMMLVVVVLMMTLLITVMSSTCIGLSGMR